MAKKPDNGTKAMLFNILGIFLLGGLFLWVLYGAAQNLNKPTPVWSDHHIVGFELADGKVVEPGTPTFQKLVASYKQSQ